MLETGIGQGFQAALGLGDTLKLSPCLPALQYFRGLTDTGFNPVALGHIQQVGSEKQRTLPQILRCVGLTLQYG